MSGLNTGTEVRGDDELLRVEAGGNDVVGEGEVVGEREGGQLGLQVLEAGARSGGVWEIELGSLLQVVGQTYADEGEECLATGDVGEVGGGVSGLRRLVVTAGGGVPWDSERVVEVHRTCRDVGSRRRRHRRRRRRRRGGDRK